MQLDSRTDSLPILLESTRTVDGQQVLLAQLPDLMPREGDDAAALDFETWIRRRVKKPSYKVTNGASWEVPSILLAVLYTSDSARARALLMALEPDLDPEDRRTALDAIAQPTDLEFEQALQSWWRPPQNELPPEYLAQRSADLERDAVKVMRRLGITPNSTGVAE